MTRVRASAQNGRVTSALRRTAITAATIVVAMLVAFAVPVSQLRTFTMVSRCCCPDPTDCHCPPSPCDDGKHDAMKRCHNSIADVVASATPAFVPAPLVVRAAPQRVAMLIPAPIARPHAAPAPTRPDAPS